MTKSWRARAVEVRDLLSVTRGTGGRVCREFPVGVGIGVQRLQNSRERKGSIGGKQLTELLGSRHGAFAIVYG